MGRVDRAQGNRKSSGACTGLGALLEKKLQRPLPSNSEWSRLKKRFVQRAGRSTSRRSKQRGDMTSRS